MADYDLVQVSELTATETPANADVLPIQQGTELKKITYANLKSNMVSDEATARQNADNLKLNKPTGGNGTAGQMLLTNGDGTTQWASPDDNLATTGKAADAKATGDAIKAVDANLAAPYSTSATYAVGDYCTKDGVLKRCKTAITTAEAWNSAHWDDVKLGGDVSTLRSALSADVSSLENLTLKNLKVGQLIEGEGILAASGGIRTNTNFVRTDYIDISDYDTIVYARRYAATSSGTGTNTVGMAFYNENKEYLRGQYQVTQQSVNHYEDVEIATPEGAKYARFTLFVSSIAPYTDFHVKALPKSNETILRLVANNTFNELYNNLYAVGTIKEGYSIISTTGDITSNADYDTSDFIPVDKLSLIYGYGNRYYFYDSNKVAISGATGVLNSGSELVGDAHYVEVPSGAAYFRICILKTQQKILYARTLYDEYLEHRNRERKLYCLGDSITRGMYAEIGTSSSTGPTSGNYPYWIGEINNYEVVNLGNSGSGWANVGSPESQDDPSTAYNAKGVIDNNSFDDADIITLAYGVNDWKGADQSVVLGDMTSVSGDGTVIGNMKYCIETLADPVNGKAKKAQIIILLPLNTNRQWSGMDTMTLANNWAFGYAYRNNQTLEDYRDAIRECAEYYNLKVIDLEEICPINRLNIRQVLGDGLHPTKAFHKQMGAALAPLIC